MQRRFCLLSALLLSLILSACGGTNQASSAPPLQLHAQPGATYSIDVQTVSQVEVNSAETPSAKPTTSATTGTLRFEQAIQSVAADGSITADISYVTSRITPTVMLGDDELASGFRDGLINMIKPPSIFTTYRKHNPLSVVFNPNATVKAIPELNQATAPQLDLAADERQRRSIQAGSANMNQTLMLLSTGGLELPQQPVALGESWTVHTDHSLGLIVIDLETTYTLDQRQDGRVRISFTGSGQTGPNAPIIGADWKLDFEFTHSGTLELDEQTGWMTASSSDQTLKGRIRLKSRNDQPVALPLTQHIHTEIKRSQ